MTTAVEGSPPHTVSLDPLRRFWTYWRTFWYNRLTDVFDSAQRVLFDDSSQFVFFSDCHRGDRSRIDIFAENGKLFLDALTHYYREGFTYVEVGDGDDLWQYGLEEVKRAYRRVFDLLHRFHQENRLHLVIGNHDISWGSRRNRVEKDGITAQEGLVLEHAQTGQQVFVVHGHQVDFMGDQLYVLGRFVVRYLWKRLQRLGFRDKAHRTEDTRKQRRLRERIVEWLQDYHQVVICGHTHRPKSAIQGMPPYFNTGSCVTPGLLTGLEIRNGEIALVRWSVSPENGGAQRELAAPPVPLGLFNWR